MSRYELVLPIQKVIEHNVTNGLGYDSKTEFNTERIKGTLEKMFLAICPISEEEVKNTEKGLKAHLFDMKSRVKLPFLEAWQDYFSTKKGIKNFIKKKRYKRLINLYKSSLRDKKELAVLSVIQNKVNDGKPLENLAKNTTYQMYLPNLNN